MRLRVATCLTVLNLVALAWLNLPSFAQGDKSGPLNFNDLPTDDQISKWLMAVSPTYRETYDAIVERSHVEGITFRSVPCEQAEFGELGVFFVGGVFEIRVSARLTGAERVKTLAFEIANAYLNEEHRQIDAGAAAGFFDARAFAVAHEIYEYEAWRLYRRFLFDLEKELGTGNLPTGLFYGIATQSVADYQLPPLFQFLKHMEDSRHMKHYIDWFQKHYSPTRPQSPRAEKLEKSAPE